MVTDVVSQSGLSAWAEGALVLFLIAFSTQAWLLWRRPLTREARLPLDDDRSEP